MKDKRQAGVMQFEKRVVHQRLGLRRIRELEETARRPTQFAEERKKTLSIEYCVQNRPVFESNVLHDVSAVGVAHRMIRGVACCSGNTSRPDVVLEGISRSATWPPSGSQRMREISGRRAAGPSSCSRGTAARHDRIGVRRRQSSRSTRSSRRGRGSSEAARCWRHAAGMTTSWPDID